MLFNSFNRSSINTPNVWMSEGLHPARHLQVARYLPLLNYDLSIENWKVLYSGKVVALDVNGYVVPAGYAIDIETAVGLGANAWDAGNLTSYLNRYSADDVSNGVKNFAGDDVEDGEPVVKSFFTDEDATDTILNPIGSPIGMLFVDAWRSNGAGYGVDGQAGDPTSYDYANYSLQQGVTVRTRYLIAVPYVSSLSALKVKGLAVYQGSSAPVHGDLVTFNASSNYVSLTPLAASTFDATTNGDPTDAEIKAESNKIITHINKYLDKGRILGKVHFIETDWPRDYMEYVRTWNAVGDTNLANVAPGSATSGLPDFFTQAGKTSASGIKLVLVNVNVI